MHVIGCPRLTKRFGPVAAVSELDLDVAAGQVYGFLGPNGAAKTTTIRMLLGLIAPTGGQARLLGRLLPDPRAVAQTGSVIEEPTFYPWLPEAEQVCDRVALIVRGRLVEEGPPVMLGAARRRTRVRVTAARIPGRQAAVGPLAGPATGRRRVSGGARQRLGRERGAGHRRCHRRIGDRGTAPAGGQVPGDRWGGGRVCCGC
jgi:ABC-type multidrug transport system ATPase subunit